MKNSILYSIVFVVSILSGCNSQSTQQTSTPQTTVSEKPTNEQASYRTLSELYEEATQVLFKSRAISATLFGLSEEDVGQYYANLLEDYSPEQEHLLRKQLLELSSRIQNYNLTYTTQTDEDTRQVMVNLTRYYGGHPDFSVGYIDVWMGLSPFVVNQINGPLLDVPRYMQNDQKIENEKDAMDYIERLGMFDKMISSIQQKLRADSAQNWIPPKVILNGALHSFDNFLKPDPEQHPLVEALTRKLETIDSISIEKKNALVKQASKKVAEVVYPAYQAIAKQTQSLLDNARDESGIWAQPNGGQYYQDAIHWLGDSDLSADEIHQLGLSEVERIVSEMDTLLKSQNYEKGSVGERMVALNDEPRFLYPDSEEGRKLLLDDLNKYIEEVSNKMTELFKTKPPYNVEVRAFPVEIQDGAPGGQYTPPSVDGSKPGVYWINLRDMKANPKFSLKTLTYHEVNPGHHWQISLNMAQEDLPFLRRISPYNAYVEGWGLYSEKVAEEMGLYENDPFGNLGRLQAELFRAVRLVVDTGLHHKRWTREQSIQYMIEITGTAESEVVAEIERYMAWPGQALGYKLGMLKILELREKAKAQLGKHFELAEFHDLVLLGGAVPMKVLESRVNNWIACKN